MQSVCVYLGAKPGNNPHFNEAALKLGHAIADGGYQLVYGGSSQGLMGTLANAVLERGGMVTGIIPRHLILKEKPLNTLDKLIYTDSMQERKYLMEQQSDTFIVIPGGLGTLEEAFETWSAIKLGIIKKTIGFLNTDGFFDGLFSFVRHCVNSGFLSLEQAQLPVVHDNPQVLLNELMPTEALSS